MRTSGSDEDDMDEGNVGSACVRGAHSCVKSNDRKERFEFEREHFIYSGVRKLAFVVTS
jgi:hypothetical protein